MVFPISNPSPLPDNTGVTPNKIRVDQVEKIAPVTTINQSADPKAAVNFAIATTLAEDSAAAKQSTANPGLIAHVGADEGGFAGAQQASSGTNAARPINPLTPELARLLNLVNDGKTPDDLVTQWPNTNLGSKTGNTENPLRQNLQALYQNLSQSPLFAANALAALLGPRLGQGHLDDQNEKLIERVRDLVQSISAESPPAKEAARLLLHGILNWQGEFLPGVKGRIRREDVWEKDPKHEGQMLRGSKIEMEINLPQSGSFKVVGVQFQDWVNLTIEPPESFKEIFAAQRESLEAGLKEHVPLDVRYQFSKKSHTEDGETQ